jgi:hypothetical protein
VTIVASGVISINSLVGEYGGSTPHSMNEYYKGGSLVLNHSNNANVPTSGTIQLDDFYGQNNSPPLDATIAGTAGESVVSGKNFSSSERGVGDGQTTQIIGSWSDQTFTNPSGSTSFTIDTLKTITGNIFIVGECSVTIKLSGNYLSSSTFSGATGWRYVKLGTTIIFDSNDTQNVTYDSNTNETQFNIAAGVPGISSGNNSHNNLMPSSGTFTATLSN